MNKLFLHCSNRRLSIIVAIMWVIGAVIATLQLVGILLQSELINEENKEKDVLIQKLVFIIVCFLLYMILKAIFDWSISRSAVRFAKGIRMELGVKMNQMQYPKLEQYDGGTIYSMASSDPQIISDWYQSLLRLGGILFQLAITLSWCFIISIPLTGFMIPSGALAIVLPTFLYKNMYQYHKTEKSTENIMNAKLVQMMKFLPTVKAYCLEDQFIHENQEALLENGNIRKKIFAQTEKGTRVGVMCGHFVTASVLVIGAYFIMYSKLTLGELYGLILIFGVFGDGLNQLISIMPKYKAYKASLERVHHFLNQEVMNESSTDSKEQLPQQPESQEAYSLSDIHYSYSQEKEILHGIQCSIKRGEKVAIVGPSGSGKTTLFKLLSGLYPLDSEQSKIILFDHEMKLENIQVLQRHISVMSQETILLEETIYNNITLYQDYEKEEVYDICQRLGLHEVVLALDEGYETKVSSLYDKLSRGQIQRIGLARVILQNREILLLDEPISALDKETGEQIYQLIESETKDKTVIMITHKLIHPDHFTRIMVMKDGEIVGFETHEHLLENCVFYQEMVELGLVVET